MCTVTFIPNNSGFTLTSSRDEVASRGATEFPIEKQLQNEKIYFPQDPKAGGTWIATSESGRVVCLLNGAFEKHKHQPPYAFSRGKVVLDSFSFNSFKDFGRNYDLSGVEPFTLILIEQNEGKTVLYELIWDGTTKYFHKMSTKSAHIWSSSTLYNNQIRNIREKWFREWLENKYAPIFEFHLSAGDLSDEFNIKMKRKEGPETVSISQINLENNTISKRHLNFILNQDNEIRFDTKITQHA